MARTNKVAVAEILGENPDNLPTLTAHIDTASLLVDDHCLASGYTDTRLELIERWLAAHFYSITSPQAESEGVRGITEKKFGKVELGLSQTRFGDQVKFLDLAGGLARFDAQIASGSVGGAGVRHLGTDPYEVA